MNSKNGGGGRYGGGGFNPMQRDYRGRRPPTGGLESQPAMRPGTGGMEPQPLLPRDGIPGVTPGTGAPAPGYSLTGEANPGKFDAPAWSGGTVGPVTGPGYSLTGQPNPPGKFSHLPGNTFNPMPQQETDASRMPLEAPPRIATPGAAATPGIGMTPPAMTDEQLRASRQRVL